MFTFSVTAIHAVITRGRIDARMNGGFRNPHYGLAPGKETLADLTNEDR